VIPRLKPRARAVVAVVAAVTAVALAIALAPAPPSHAAESPATPATLADVFARAQPGDVIRLAAGDYGRFGGGVKAGMVTLAPVAGATATIVPDLDGAANIRFEGLTVGQTTLRNARDIEFVGDRFVGMARVDTPRPVANAGILFSANTFLGIDQCSNCFEGRLTVNGDDNTVPVGVTISGNRFGDGGGSDGVQIVGGAYGVEVLDNEFDHLLQGDYEAHVDPLQLYGSSHTHIAGNYFHDNDTGIMAPDGADHELIEDNLFVSRTSGYPWPIVLGSDVGSTLVHNTLVDGACEFNIRCGTLRVYGGNSGQASRDTVVRDNVFTAFATDGGAALAADDHNLVLSGKRGAGDAAGVPRYAGGGDTRQSFRLAAGSPGKGAASDGGDVGILDHPAPPPPPVTAPPAGAGAGSGTAPLVSLVRPKPGSAVVSTLHALAHASDDSGIARVEIWIDGSRQVSLTRSPYSRTRRLASTIHAGTRTVTARAVARDGQVGSAAVTVVRRRHAAATVRGRAWRVASRPVAAGTQLSGKGPARGRVTVTLTQCGDRRARSAGHLDLRAARDGKVSAGAGAGLCILRLRPR
jgi:hypothetical protein